MSEIKHFHGQMSDHFRTALFIILSGGFQDAYTYISRGGVFANARVKKNPGVFFYKAPGCKLFDDRQRQFF